MEPVHMPPIPRDIAGVFARDPPLVQAVEQTRGSKG
jgi:hypothetical protein